MPTGKKYIPTDADREEVSLMKAYGLRHQFIADRLRISEDTLERHFKKELENGLENANRQVAGVLFELATVKKDKASVMFWLKTRAGWREKEPEDKDGFKSLVEELLKKVPNSNE